MSNKTGGPAFPYSGVHKGEKENLIVDSHGMTLRDYFAGKAMQARLSNPQWIASDERTALDAYQVADAMLRAREAS
ncbi:hypothetical protein [Enterobacter bugandensis]|uniref:hypothetical protein n=1 Tax=Enterobacter bugandensis TaxID=881260 RepID=UPI0037550F2E